MKLINTSDYIIFFDNVRVDPYVVSWNSTIGLFASDATATITMFRSDAMDNWKAYLTQVRVFTKNIFTGKFGIVFEGEIIGRNWNENRADMGKVSFTVKGFYHWLEVPVPMMISNSDKFSQLKRFEYEAQNINIDALNDFMTTSGESTLKDKDIEGVINTLFDKLNSGYYDVTKTNSTFAWAKVKERFKVMVDVLEGFRKSGFMDIFTLVKATQIQSFYVYLNDVLSQLMFEFYQDRDGTFKIKTPSWDDAILKDHILDEMVVADVTGLDQWDQEPTRVITVGGLTEFEQNAVNNGFDPSSSLASIPVGVYIGTPQKGQYFSTTVDAYLQDYGAGLDTINSNSVVDNSQWFDNITGIYPITSAHGSVNPSRPDHQGTDYGMATGTQVNNIGGPGTVVLVTSSAARGKYIVVEENIDGNTYQFVYQHLSEYKVRQGQSVQPGQLLALSGATGDVTGPHLHFEIWLGAFRKGTNVNPDKFLKDMKTHYQTTNDGIVPSGPSSAKFDTSAAQMGEWRNFKMTAYDAFCEAIGKFKPCSGVTATGYDVSNTIKYKQYRIIAVDPKVIPLWSICEIQDSDSTFEAIALDVGGMIKGYHVDLLSTKAQIKGFTNPIVKIRITGKLDKKTGKITSSVFSGETLSSSSDSNTSSPFANVTGSTYLPISMQRIRLADNDPYNNSSSDTPKAVAYKSYNGLLYSLPTFANMYKSILQNNPHGVDGNLIASIIGITSGWREKYDTDNHRGLTALNVNYINDILSGMDVSDGFVAIDKGSEFFAACYKRFGKITFALAAYWIGDMSRVEDVTKDVKSLDFTKSRSKLDSIDNSVLAFVDNVVSAYTDLYDANYLEGDPNKSFGVAVDYVGHTVSDKAPTDNTSIPDYQSQYKPMLTDDELKYKVNVQIVEQQLIKTDSPVVADGTFTPDELVYRYSVYMMQVFRANAHTVGVQLMTSLPSLRPGFNAWLEPTRKDLVFYITGVSHQGAFGQGCFTTVQGSFVRDPDTYDKLGGSIFVGEQRATAKDFGNVVTTSSMGALRTKLKGLRDSDEVAESDQNAILKDLYTAPTKTNDYTTDWNGEFTADELITKINTLYKTAPPIVLTRCSELKTAIQKSEDDFLKYLLMTRLGG